MTEASLGNILVISLAQVLPEIMDEATYTAASHRGAARERGQRQLMSQSVNINTLKFRE